MTFGRLIDHWWKCETQSKWKLGAEQATISRRDRSSLSELASIGFAIDHYLLHEKLPSHRAMFFFLHLPLCFWFNSSECIVLYCIVLYPKKLQMFGKWLTFIFLYFFTVASASIWQKFLTRNGNFLKVHPICELGRLPLELTMNVKTREGLELIGQLNI